MGREMDIEFDEIKKGLKGVYGWIIAVFIGILILAVGGALFYQSFKEDFINKMGGVEKISIMTSEDLTIKIKKEVPELDYYFDYLVRCPEFIFYKGGFVPVDNYFFMPEAKGEWRNYEGDFFCENLKEVIGAKMIFEKYEKPVIAICSGTEFLFPVSGL